MRNLSMVVEKVEKTEHISLTYNGAEVDNGLIDISDIVDGLIGFQDCYNRIKEIGKIDSSSTLKIKSFKKGSFVVDIINSVRDNADWLLPTFISIPGCIWAIIQIKKHLKGKKAKSFKSENNLVVLENEEGEKLKIEGDSRLLEKLIDDEKIMKSVWQMTRPINKNSIDSFDLKIENEDKKILEASISFEEKKWFDYVGRKDITTKKEILIGEIRSWDKKTNNGKFIYKNKVLPAFFVMNDPQNYYKFFSLTEPVQVECELSIDEDLEINKI